MYFIYFLIFCVHRISSQSSSNMIIDLNSPEESLPESTVYNNGLFINSEKFVTFLFIYNRLKYFNTSSDLSLHSVLLRNHSTNNLFINLRIISPHSKVPKIFLQQKAILYFICVFKNSFIFI
jgi:hypothetical protein